MRRFGMEADPPNFEPKWPIFQNSYSEAPRSNIKKHGHRGGGFPRRKIRIDGVPPEYSFQEIQDIAAKTPASKRQEPAIDAVVQYQTKYLGRIPKVVTLPFVDIVSFARDDLYGNPVESGQLRIRVKTVGKSDWSNRLLEPKELAMALEFPETFEVWVSDGEKLYQYSNLASKVCNTHGFTEVWSKCADKVISHGQIVSASRDHRRSAADKFVINSDILINPPENASERFWIARVVSKTDDSIRVRWYERESEGRYVNKFVEDNIPVVSVFEDIIPNLKSLGGERYQLVNLHEIERLVYQLYSQQ